MISLAHARNICNLPTWDAGHDPVLYESRLSPLNHWPMIGAGLCLIPLYGTGIVIMLLTFIDYLTMSLATTGRRLAFKSGALGRGIIDLDLDNVRTAQIHQGPVGRRFNFGSIALTLSGGEAIRINGVINPAEFCRQMRLGDRLVSPNRSNNDEQSARPAQAS